MEKPFTANMLKMILISTILAVISLIGFTFLAESEALILAYFILFISFLTGYFLLKWGFDYYRIKYSFSLTFLVVAVFLYDLIILLTGATGLLLQSQYL